MPTLSFLWMYVILSIMPLERELYLKIPCAFKVNEFTKIYSVIQKSDKFGFE